MRRSGWSLSLLLCGMIAAGAARAADEAPGEAPGEARRDAAGAPGVAAQPVNAATGGELQLPATPENGIVRLTIRTDNPQVQLKRKVARLMGARGGWLVEELICRAPCGVVVDGRKGEEFYFGGKAVVPSAPFQLIDYSGNLEATVNEGSRLARRLGGVSCIVGIVGAVIAASAAVANEKLRSSGLIIGGVFAGVALGGCLLHQTAGKTSVDFHPAPSN